MKFNIDNALSPVVAVDLRNAGYDAIHVCDLSMGDASDEDIFKTFQSKNHVLISADTDFGTLIAQKQSQYPSLLLFHRITGRSPKNQVLILLTYLPMLKEYFEKGCIVVIEEKRLRVRLLPIGAE